MAQATAPILDSTETDEPTAPHHVCYQGQSRKHLLDASISPFDPGCVKTLSCRYDSPVILWGN